MKSRSYHIRKYTSFPDLVTIDQARTMLGWVGMNTVYKLVRSKRLFACYIRGTYLIPKSCLIDFIFSDHYQKLKDTLSHQV